MAAANKVPNININRKNDDPFYRYKMPKLIAKVEGRGNGIKTVIPNMAEIAKALDRPPSYTTKYFGCELGAQTVMDEKNERYIVNGAHQDEDLQNLLDGFIEKFVLCPGCENPETRLKVVKKTIDQKCVACGYRGPLRSNHRLTTFIINHPPNSDGGKKGKKDKKDRRKGKGSTADDEDADADADAGQGSSGAAAGAGGAGVPSSVRDNVAERDGGMVAAPEIRDVDEDDWSIDTSAEAVRQREEAQLAGAVSKLVLANDAEKTLEERLELFHGYVEQRAELPKFPAKDVLAYAERLECKEKGVMVLVEFLLDDDMVTPSLKAHQALFQRFTDGSKKTQKYLLHALEKMVEKRPSLMARLPNIFMALYELDIVEEMAFVSWNEKVTKKYVPRELNQAMHDKAAPFMKWLDEAETDDDEEEEEAGIDEEEVQFDTGVSTIKTETIQIDPAEIAAAKAAAAAAEGREPEAEDEDEEDDIDIDDI